MAKYTYKDIIIDPTSEEAKNCIGKVVYFADSPTTCLGRANNDDKYHCKILQRIELNDYCPFIVDNGCVNWGSIILKKEELKPEYIPFSNPDEFLDAYEDSTYINLGSVGNKLLSRGGIWLKYKATDAHLVVTEMWSNGLTVGNDIAVTRWNELLKYYEFLDGTPCGKLKGEEL